MDCILLIKKTEGIQHEAGQWDEYINSQIYETNADDTVSNAPNPAPIPSIPSLPTGAINNNTVDCVNVSAKSSFSFINVLKLKW